jgi:hypothetical protein
MGAENLVPNGFRSPDSLGGCEPLYRLNSPGVQLRTVTCNLCFSASLYTYVHVQPITAWFVYSIGYRRFTGLYLLSKLVGHGSYFAFLKPKHPFVKTTWYITFLYVLELSRNMSQKTKQFYICSCKIAHSLPQKHFNPLTPELNSSAQRCLTTFLLRILLLEPCISLIYAWKPNKYTNYSFRFLIMYVAATCFGIKLPSSGSVPSAFWEMLNWGSVDRILWMGVLCLVTWCVVNLRLINRMNNWWVFWFLTHIFTGDFNF